MQALMRCLASAPGATQFRAVIRACVQASFSCGSAPEVSTVQPACERKQDWRSCS
jgi:hypothetical protein